MYKCENCNKLTRKIKSLEKKNKDLVEIVMKLFFMNPIERHMAIEIIKRAVNEMPQKDFEKVLDGKLPYFKSKAIVKKFGEGKVEKALDKKGQIIHIMGG